MSHLNGIKQRIYDLEAVEATAKALNGTLVKQSNYKWYGSHVGDYPLPEGFTAEDLGKCEYAIKVPGTTWEIGVAKGRGHDYYTLLFDFWGSRGEPLKNFVGGEDGRKWKQEYSLQAAALKARRLGYQVHRTKAKGKEQLFININR